MTMKVTYKVMCSGAHVMNYDTEEEARRAIALYTREGYVKIASIALERVVTEELKV